MNKLFTNSPLTNIEDQVSPCIIPMYQNTELIKLNNYTSGIMYDFMCNYSSQFAIYTGVMNGTYRIVIEVSKLSRNNYVYLDTFGNYYYVYYVSANEVLCDKIVTKNSSVFTTNMRLIIDYVNHPIELIPKYIIDANSVQLKSYCKTMLSDNLVNNKIIDFDDNDNINSLASLMFDDDGEYLTNGTVKFHKTYDKKIVISILNKLDKLIQNTYSSVDVY
jgi:hypothetical protein